MQQSKVQSTFKVLKDSKFRTTTSSRKKMLSKTWSWLWCKCVYHPLSRVGSREIPILRIIALLFLVGQWTACSGSDELCGQEEMGFAWLPLQMSGVWPVVVPSAAPRHTRQLPREENQDLFQMSRKPIGVMVADKTSRRNHAEEINRCQPLFWIDHCQR